MIGLPFIHETATAILKQSTTIAGRCYLAPHLGSELNATNLDQVIASVKEQVKKYPLVILLPPHLTGDFTNPKPGFLRYPMRAYFVKQTYNTSDNRVSQPGVTGKSTHTIADDWHDMQRCAMEFMRLQGLVSQREPNRYHVGTKTPNAIDYISTIGNDRLSGVLLSYDAYLPGSCEGDEDYPPGAIDNIQLPAGDSHPHHKM